MRRVVITGLGIVSPVGNSVEEAWKNITSAKSGISKITRFDTTDFKVKIAGEVKGLDPVKCGIDPKEAGRMDPFEIFAACSAREAVADAGFLGGFGDIPPERIATYIGVGIGGLKTIEEGVRVLVGKGPSRVSPYFVPISISNMAAGYVSLMFGTKGPCLSTTTACAAGLHSIGQSYQLIKWGICDLSIAGGSEAPITPIGVASFSSMKALSTNNEEPEKASRPFDKNRNGFVMGEGAGVLILEEYEHAKKRGAKIYAEIVGFGMSSDAYHITAPDPDGYGFYLSMKNSLQDANISPEKIEYINAHGTSTKYNDVIETKAIKSLFGNHSNKLWVSSTKSMTGHLLGAAGAVELVFSALSIHKSIIPPTINLDEPDPECDLDYVPNTAREKKISYAMCNSFGFGGTNGVIVLKRL